MLNDQVYLNTTNDKKGMKIPHFPIVSYIVNMDHRDGSMGVKHLPEKVLHFSPQDFTQLEFSKIFTWHRPSRLLFSPSLSLCLIYSLHWRVGVIENKLNISHVVSTSTSEGNGQILL